MLYVLGAVSLFLVLRLFRRKPKSRSVFHWAGRGWDWPSVQQGLIAFGGIGSGKSYSTEEYIRQLIRAGCPVLSTAVKVDEADRYERICREEGCLDRFRRITPENTCLDVMGELMRNKTPADATGMLMALGDIEKRDTGSGDGAAFWRSKEENAIDCAIRLCMATGIPPSIENIYKIVMSAPILPGQNGRGPDGQPINPEYAFSTPEREDMRLFPKLMRRYYQKVKNGGAEEYNRILDVFMKEMCATDKIYGGVMAGLTGLLGRFVLQPMLDALSKPGLTPKQIEDERLICVIDYPLMRYFTSARLYACIWVMLTQRYLMSRDASTIKQPFVIVRDEAGWTLHAEWDAKAHNTLRSQKCVDIAIVQCLDTLQAALGASEKAKHEAMAFSSNHMHKLFFGNYSQATNSWASEMSGQFREVMPSSGHQDAKDFAGRVLGAQSLSWNMNYQPVVRPEQFNQLPVGHAYLMSGGRVVYVNFRKKRKR